MTPESSLDILIDAPGWAARFDDIEGLCRRATDAARSILLKHQAGYLDLRGRLAVRTSGLTIDTEVTPVKLRAERVSALSGQAGQEVARAILARPTRPVAIRELARELGRSPGTVSEVLAALRRAGPPYEQSPGQLASTTMVTSGTMTARVKKLEGRGLVRRRTDPQDGRAVIVTLTDEGRATVSGALASLLVREQALLSPLTSREQASLAQLLRPLLQPLDSPSG